MKFYGIQKLSLVDYDDEVSCTLFMRGCNMRCPFCHNFELVVFNDAFSEALNEDELKEFLKSHVGKLSAVVITGGEPTLDPELKDMCIYLKGLGYKVKLDSNGTNPDVVIDLINNKLIDYVAIDIKNSIEGYNETIGKPYFDMDGIKRTVSYLISHNFPYEFRTTLIQEFHNKERIEAMGEWIKGAKKLFLQKFVVSEFVPEKTLNSVPTKNALEFRRILEKYVNQVSLRGY